MQRKFYLYIFLLILFINACSVGKEYQRPTVQLPQQFDAAVPSDSGVAAIEWRNFFKDPVLIGLIDSTL